MKQKESNIQSAEERSGERKKKRRAGSVLRLVILFAALGVFLFSAWKLYTIFHTYHLAENEYSGLQEEFVTEAAQESEEDEEAVREKLNAQIEAAVAEKGQDDPEVTETAEDLKLDLLPEEGEPIVVPPLDIDFAELQEINPDVIGWLYVEAIPSINYPILQGEDNEYYLHRTFRKEALFPGSIFVECQNSPDFTDPHTIVYGHNMRNGSMFGMLKTMRTQEVYDKSPYFWVFTPEASMRYKIFSTFETSATGDVYVLFSRTGEEFLEWETQWQEASRIKNGVPLKEHDRVVTLSTCTSNSERRCVVMGKRVIYWPTDYGGTVRQEG